MPKYDRERLPDAHGLVDIESSFSKLVGNKLAAALDPKFLKLVVHVAFGESKLLTHLTGISQDQDKSRLLLVHVVLPVY